MFWRINDEVIRCNYYSVKSKNLISNRQLFYNADRFCFPGSVVKEIIVIIMNWEVLENQRFAVAHWQFTNVLWPPRNSISKLPVYFKDDQFQTALFTALNEDCITVKVHLFASCFLCLLCPLGEELIVMQGTLKALCKLPSEISDILFAREKQRKTVCVTAKIKAR